MELTNPYCSVAEANDFNQIREMLKPAGLICWILLVNKLSGYTKYFNTPSQAPQALILLFDHLVYIHLFAIIAACFFFKFDDVREIFKGVEWLWIEWFN